MNPPKEPGRALRGRQSTFLIGENLWRHSRYDKRPARRYEDNKLKTVVQIRFRELLLGRQVWIARSFVV